MITVEQFKKEKFAINCETKELSDRFLEFLDSMGCTWHKGTSLNYENKHHWNGRDMCYVYNYKGISDGTKWARRSDGAIYNYKIFTPYDIIGFYNNDLEIDVEEWEAIFESA